MDKQLKARHLKTVLCAALAACFCGCSSSHLSESDRYQSERYHQKDDSAPVAPESLEHVNNAVPRYEPKSRGGNQDYTVRGKRYKVLKNEEGFSETGFASWYGKKFHGHKTSNGEIYDMYAMSAAHKHLPLPSYVKVTRLDNGKQVIVRVNDRGPFHTGRIIDLSYAAAYKLGMLGTGTAQVGIEAITTPPPWNNKDPLLELVSKKEKELEGRSLNAKAPSKSSGRLFVQIATTQDKRRATRLATQLASLYNIKGRTVVQNNIHKIQLGPLPNEREANKLLEMLKKGEFSSAFKVYQ